MPESTYARVDFIPPVRDFEFGLWTARSVYLQARDRNGAAYIGDIYLQQL
jgi:hypothetical protein